MSITKRLKLMWFAIKYPEIYASAPMVTRAVIDGVCECTVIVSYKDGTHDIIEYKLTKAGEAV